MSARNAFERLDELLAEYQDLDAKRSAKWEEALQFFEAECGAFAASHTLTPQTSVSSLIGYDQARRQTNWARSHPAARTSIGPDEGADEATVRARRHHAEAEQAFTEDDRLALRFIFENSGTSAAYHLGLPIESQHLTGAELLATTDPKLLKEIRHGIPRALRIIAAYDGPAFAGHGKKYDPVAYRRELEARCEPSPDWLDHTHGDASSPKPARTRL